MKKISFLLTALSIGFLATGCAPRLGPNNYSITDAGKVNQTLPGQIMGMRTVNISSSRTAADNQPGTGAAIGATSGAVLGSTIGQGRGSLIAGLGGALIGGIAGHYAGQALTDQQGYEYQIRLDRGDILTIAQGAEPALRIGQRVLVVMPGFSGDRGRVIPDMSY